MLVKELKRRFHKELDPIYQKEEVGSYFFMLMEHFCQLNRLDIALNTNQEISTEKCLEITSALELLKLQKPIQYIIGETEFYGLKFKVNSDVLIPRPETEELVDWIVKDVTFNMANSSMGILDIGSGSGCIAVALAKFLPNAKVYGLDISKEALELAKINAELNDAEVEFIHENILNYKKMTHLKKHFLFDIIVSNPPYVRYKEKEQMKSNVLDNEPHLALFVKDEDPLLFYRAITEFAVNNLKPKGKLFFEINEYLGEEMKALVGSYSFDEVEIKQDLFSKDRMIKAIRK